MLNHSFKNELDRIFANGCYGAVAKIILGTRNQKLLNDFEYIFNHLVKRIEIFELGESTELLHDDVKGICYIFKENKELGTKAGDLGIAIYGLNGCNNDSVDIVIHSGVHEFAHAFIELSSKACSKHPNGINKNGRVRKNSFGAIKEGETEYGVMFSETIVDMIASIAAPLIKGNNPEANQIINENYKKWKAEETEYSFLTSITRLMIAAFSVDGNVDYDQIINSNNSIFQEKRRMNDGTEKYLNDFLYGMVFDPLSVEEEYDFFMGDGQFKEICLLFDNLFQDYRNNKTIRNSQYFSDTIKKIMKTIPEFMNKRMSYYQRMGMLNVQQINAINSNFNRIWNAMQIEFSAYFSSREVDDIVEENKRRYL